MKTYTDSELKNFYSTFSGIILDKTEISSVTKMTETNRKYDTVLNYFKQFKHDEIANSLDLILGSQVSIIEKTKFDCGCNTSTGSEITTCKSIYDETIIKTCIDMFSNPDFYVDWMYNDSKQPTNELITELINFIQQFIDKGWDLTLSTKKTYKCGCQQINTTESENNYLTLKKYLLVLGFVLNCEIDSHKDEIKVYGKEFGELFHRLILV